MPFHENSSVVVDIGVCVALKELQLNDKVLTPIGFSNITNIERVTPSDWETRWYGCRGIGRGILSKSGKWCVRAEDIDILLAASNRGIFSKSSEDILSELEPYNGPFMGAHASADGWVQCNYFFAFRPNNDVFYRIYTDNGLIIINDFLSFSTLRAGIKASDVSDAWVTFAKEYQYELFNRSRTSN